MSILKNKKWLISLGLIIIVGFLAWHYYPKAKVSLPSMAVQKGNITKRVTIAGTVSPKRQNTIVAGYNGYIKKLYVSLGQKVKQGDNLVSVTESLQSDDKVYPMKAYYAGTVVLINNREGEHVTTTGTSPILVVDDLSTLYIKANVPENDIPGIKVGQKATINVTPLFTKHFSGVVEDISLAAADQQSNSFGFGSSSQAQYPVRIKITSQSTQIRPGMSAKIDIITALQKGALVLPHQYIDHSAKFADFVTLADGTVRKVTLGLQDDANVEIIKGLKLGQKVRQVDYMDKLGKQ